MPTSWIPASAGMTSKKRKFNKVKIWLPGVRLDDEQRRDGEPPMRPAIRTTSIRPCGTRSSRRHRDRQRRGGRSADRSAGHGAASTGDVSGGDRHRSSLVRSALSTIGRLRAASPTRYCRLGFVPPTSAGVVSGPSLPSSRSRLSLRHRCKRPTLARMASRAKVKAGFQLPLE